MKKLQNVKVLCFFVALAGHTTFLRYPFIPADLTRDGFSPTFVRCTYCHGRYKIVDHEMERTGDGGGAVQKKKLSPTF